MQLPVPVIYQENEYACGPACLQMILAFYGKTVPQKQLIKQLQMNENGTLDEKMLGAARKFGFSAVKRNGLTVSDIVLSLERNTPVITTVRMKLNGEEVPHYVVVKGYTSQFLLNNPFPEQPQYLSFARYRNDSESYPGDMSSIIIRPR